MTALLLAALIAQNAVDRQAQTFYRYSPATMIASTAFAPGFGEGSQAFASPTVIHLHRPEFLSFRIVSRDRDSCLVKIEWEGMTGAKPPSKPIEVFEDGQFREDVQPESGSLYRIRNERGALELLVDGCVRIRI